MKTSLATVLVAGLLASGGLSVAWVLAASTSTAAAQPPPPPPVPVNLITEIPADQTIHTTIDAVSYLYVYGDFSNPVDASVELQSGDCLFSASIYYSDDEVVIIEVVALGAPVSAQIKAARLEGDDLTVTVGTSPPYTPPAGTVPIRP